MDFGVDREHQFQGIIESFSYIAPHTAYRPSAIVVATLSEGLLFWNLNLASLYIIRDVLWATAIDLAASAEGSTKNLQNGALQVLGHRLEPHCARNGDDLVKGHTLSVLDVLLLFAVSGRLLKGLDDERRGGGNDGNSSLTVLNGQLDRDAQSLPVSGGLGNVFTDLCTPH
jgi:hypothetical protein